jgi:hypothetical protein
MIIRFRLERRVFDFIDVDKDGKIGFNDFAATFYLGTVLLHRSDLTTPGAGRAQQKERGRAELTVPEQKNAQHVLSEMKRILKQMSGRSATHLATFKRFKWMCAAEPDKGVSFAQFRIGIARMAMYSVSKSTARQCFDSFDVLHEG